MKVSKKIYIISILVFILIMLLTTVSKAEEIPYVTYENISSNNGVIFGGDEIGYNMSSNNYQFTIIGHNLNNESNYNFELKSDFKNYSVTYTGKELMNGITYSSDDGNSIIYSKVYDNISEKELKIMQNNEYIDKIYFYFNENLDFTEMDEYANTIIKDGKVEIDAIKPNNIDYYETVISSVLKSKYENQKYTIYGGYDGLDQKYFLYLAENDNYHKNKTYNVEYIFAEPNEKVLKNTDKYLSKIPTEGEVEDNLFVLDDLENINYRYAIIKNGNVDYAENELINYSSEIQKLFDYDNLTVKLDTRAGWYDQFSSGGYGFINLLYGGIVYGTIEPSGVKLNNVIYIPNNIENTTDAYIEAALDRIKEYIPNAVVSIEYAGLIKDINQVDWIIPIEDIVDVTKTLGEYYTITINGEKHNFFIVKDSSKMKQPFMKTTDLTTGLTINTEASEVPLDSKIIVKVIENNSEEYNAIINKLGVEDGKIFDLDLYSNTTNTYIKKLGNGMFKVYIPIEEKDLNKNLKVFYIKDDESIEEYDVTLEDNYAIFETDHFSTYTLAEIKEQEEEINGEVSNEDSINEDFNKNEINKENKKNETENRNENNPKTGDLIILQAIIFIVSLIGVFFTNKKYNKYLK